jgi:hyperosmotically inducible protein
MGGFYPESGLAFGVFESLWQLRRGNSGATVAVLMSQGDVLMQSFRVYFCALTLAVGLAVAQKNGGSADQTNALQANNGQDRISREVRHELVMLPYYGVFDNLAYGVNGGVVTLFGQVTNPTLKSDAGNVVKRIEGVTKVDNRIEVLPLSPNDDQIRRAAYRAIYSEPSLNRYAMQAVPPVHIIVDNGKVTLVGVVDNASDKNLAGIRANTVPGAFSVTNNLQVLGK